MTSQTILSTQASCADIYEIGLLPVELALNKILSAIDCINDYEFIAIDDAKGRTLAENIVATFSVPKHNNSAVDGYALNASDLPTAETASLPIVGTAYAGTPFLNVVNIGQCIRIMTGAAIPDGVDTVIMQEHVDLNDTHIIIDNRHQAGQNIRLAGEDIQNNETILQSGRFLTPADIGLMASLGIAEIQVKRKLKIAIASTGNEVKSIGDFFSKNTGIYDSNRYSLNSALNRPDIEIYNLGIIEDNPEVLLKCFEQASHYADIIISSGGVSVGDADHTKTALQQSGNVEFWKIAIKPGRPLAFGHIGKSIFFGLPGNPVAVMVTLSQFVFPALEKLSGTIDGPISPILQVKTTEDIRKKPGRTEIVRSLIEQDSNGEWTVKTTGKQGSGILRSMSLANSFIILEHDRASVKAGEIVSVQLFSGLFY